MGESPVLTLWFFFPNLWVSNYFSQTVSQTDWLGPEQSEGNLSRSEQRAPQERSTALSEKNRLRAFIDILLTIAKVCADPYKSLKEAHMSTRTTHDHDAIDLLAAIRPKDGKFPADINDMTSTQALAIITSLFPGNDRVKKCIEENSGFFRDLASAKEKSHYLFLDLLYLFSWVKTQKPYYTIDHLQLHGGRLFYACLCYSNKVKQGHGLFAKEFFFVHGLGRTDVFFCFDHISRPSLNKGDLAFIAIDPETHESLAVCNNEIVFRAPPYKLSWPCIAGGQVAVCESVEFPDNPKDDRFREQLLWRHPGPDGTLVDYTKGPYTHIGAMHMMEIGGKIAFIALNRDELGNYDTNHNLVIWGDDVQRFPSADNLQRAVIGKREVPVFSYKRSRELRTPGNADIRIWDVDIGPFDYVAHMRVVNGLVMADVEKDGKNQFLVIHPDSLDCFAKLVYDEITMYAVVKTPTFTTVIFSAYKDGNWATYLGGKKISDGEMTYAAIKEACSPRVEDGKLVYWTINPTDPTSSHRDGPVTCHKFDLEGFKPMF
jgi:hypothetical protein